MLSPALEQFEQPGRSKRLRSARPSSARAARKESHHPSRILSGRSSPAQAGVVSALQSHLTPLPRDVSDPRTGALAGLEFAPAYSRWATSNRLLGSAPKQPGHGPSAPSAAPRAPGLRRPPADKLVTSEKEAAVAGVCPCRRQRAFSKSPKFAFDSPTRGSWPGGTDEGPHRYTTARSKTTTVPARTLRKLPVFPNAKVACWAC
jgi:hypothetical protein